MLKPKEIIIPLTKCILILYEDEIYKYMDAKMLTLAIRRGKRYKRMLRIEQYEKSRIYPTDEDINGYKSKI